MPKSSTANRTPISWMEVSAVVTAKVSSISTLSVISRQSAEGAKSCEARTEATDWRMPGPTNCRPDRFTAMVNSLQPGRERQRSRS